MATTRRRTTFTGIAAQAVRELIGLQDDLGGATDQLRAEAIGTTTDTKTAKFHAAYNQRCRVLFPAAGDVVSFPPANSQSQNKWIEVIKIGGGNIKIVPTSGLIQGAASVTLTTSGFYYFQSDGLSSWWMQPVSGGGGLSPPVVLTDLQTIAANSWLGNITGGVAAITVNTLAQLKTYIGNMSAGVAGLAPAGSGVATQFLNGNGAYAVPASAAPTGAANTMLGNPTAGAATDIDIAMAAQSTVIRAAANIINATAAADTCLQRLGSADLGYGNTPRLMRAPQVVTATNAAFAHPTGTRFIIVEGVGSGAAGGGCAATPGSCGSGGNSGNWGRKTFTSISGTSNITIGAAGTGVSGAAGNNGGNCSFVHNAVTFTLPGGIGGTLLAGAATVASATANAGNAASTGADIGTVGQVGKRAFRNAASASSSVSGDGGSNTLGSGGFGFAGVNGAGVAATGHGSGGGGANCPISAAAAAGAAGTIGCFIIWEFG